MNTQGAVIESFQGVLHNKEQRLAKEITLLADRALKESYEELFLNAPDYYEDLYQEEGLVMLIYENDSLKYWSNNSIAVENWRNNVCLDVGLNKLNNGIFDVFHKSLMDSGGKSIVGLVLIKNAFPHQNKFLRNDYFKDFAFANDAIIHTEKVPNPQHHIYSINNNYLFSLQFKDEPKSSKIKRLAVGALSFLGVIALFLAVAFQFKDNLSKTNSFVGAVFFLLCVCLLRLLSIKTSIPGVFYEMDLFNPSIYADSSSVWLSSLGDLLLNSLLLLLTALYLQNVLSFDKVANLLRIREHQWRLTVLYLIYYLVAASFFSAVVGLIQHSHIPFSINNVFSLNRYSAIALFIMALLYFICFMLANTLINWILSSSEGQRKPLVLFIVATIIYAGIMLVFNSAHWLILIAPILLFLLPFYLKQRRNSYSFSHILVLLFFFSVVTGFITNHFTLERESKIQKVYAQKLAGENDLLAEYLFVDIEKKINQDTILKQRLVAGNYDEFRNRLKQSYFTGFWEKYDIRLAHFDTSCVILLKEGVPQFSNSIHYNELIENQAVPVTSHLFYIPNSKENVRYIAKFNFQIVGDSLRSDEALFVEFGLRKRLKVVGYPELLLDKNFTKWGGLQKYSFAKYENDNLVDNYGDYRYKSSPSDFLIDNGAGNSVLINDFIHFLYPASDELLIVLSKPVLGLKGELAAVSYLFAGFSMMLLGFYLVNGLWTGRWFETLSLKYRIQILMVGVVFLSMVLLGGGTVYYIYKQSKVGNIANIIDKTYAVEKGFNNSVEANFTFKQSLQEYSTFMLKKYASVFSTDINLYDVNGNLWSTSRNQVFEDGLLSRKMNTSAYTQMKLLGSSRFVHTERIGGLEYLSAYIPMKNASGTLLGYLNVPYFSKHDALKKEISTLLVTLINIYILLFALSIIVSTIISNYVTNPLKLIQDKFVQTKLNDSNEPIDWGYKDEIGSLVDEYNKMIAKLSESARLLAQSEREGAWREMAKQVAHEIKNPLTPMKLGLQHLNRLMQDDLPDKEQKIKDLTKTIIEQIDSLSVIATEFSNFAKMPAGKMKKVDMVAVINNCIDLFREENNVEIIYTGEANNVYVNADREQLVRVFNNLIKNAVQAIPDDVKGRVEVNVKVGKTVVVEIHDNGKGINEDIANDIFVPNFTTKSSGMGLGLAMVKSLIEGMGGDIALDRTVQVGAKFRISLKRFVEN